MSLEFPGYDTINFAKFVLFLLPMPTAAVSCSVALQGQETKWAEM